MQACPLTVVQMHSDCVYFLVLLATEEPDRQAADEGGYRSHYFGEPLLWPKETSGPSVRTLCYHNNYQLTKLNFLRLL